MSQNVAGPTTTTDERRAAPDRRRRPTPWISRYTFLGRGRRFRHRRLSDALRSPSVDRYEASTVVLVLTSILLSVADALFTLQLVELGAREINPLMDFFLGYGPAPFLLVKYFITGVSLLVLLVHKQRPLLGGRLRGRDVLYAVPFIYSLVILWELSLILRLG